MQFGRFLGNRWATVLIPVFVATVPLWIQCVRNDKGKLCEDWLYKAWKDKVFGFCKKFFWVIIAVLTVFAVLEHIGWKPIATALVTVGKSALLILVILVLAIITLIVVAHVRERRVVKVEAGVDDEK